ncbi:hypothetical protein T479_15200 [Lysinibacillus varians]|nr:hypothetical protein T479_15200 [Lysinibacillus varians]
MAIDSIIELNEQNIVQSGCFCLRYTLVLQLTCMPTKSIAEAKTC